MQDFARYEKQILFKPIGLTGQKKLARSRIGILGAGALGSNLANILCRSGIGEIVLADQDRVELSNLQRQMLFTEKDVGFAKAVKAARKLAKINSEVKVEAFYQQVNEENFTQLFKDCDLIFDASDNFPARFLINRMSQKYKFPWIFSGVTAASGQSMLIVPSKTACLGCLFPEETPLENFPTVHNSGIITSIVTIIASISAAVGIKYLIEKTTDNSIVYFDAWEQQFNKALVSPTPDCSCCRPPRLRRK